MCWVNKQYYVPFNEQMPPRDAPRESISYYRWVPIIILTQAWVFFYTGVVWRLIHQRLGFSLVAVVESAITCKASLDVETRAKTIRYMVMQVDSYLRASQTHKKSWCVSIKRVLSQYCCIVCGRFNGNYLTCTYLSIKLLYVSSVVLQIVILDNILGFDGSYYMLGLHRLLKAFRHEDADSQELFPRVTLCEFFIRQHTNLQMYTVQCALPINLFNEKIFLFIWFLLTSLAITTFLNFLHWLSKLLIVSVQVDFVKRELLAVNQLSQRELEAVKKFTHSYLRRDGLFILRLVSKNAGDMIAAELLHGLWTNMGPQHHLVDHKPLIAQEIV